VSVDNEELALHDMAGCLERNLPESMRMIFSHEDDRYGAPHIVWAEDLTIARMLISESKVRPTVKLEKVEDWLQISLDLPSAIALAGQCVVWDHQEDNQAFPIDDAVSVVFRELKEAIANFSE
jgi:hypothetical protein